MKNSKSDSVSDSAIKCVVIGDGTVGSMFPNIFGQIIFINTFYYVPRNLLVINLFYQQIPN